MWSEKEKMSNLVYSEDDQLIGYRTTAYPEGMYIIDGTIQDTFTDSCGEVHSLEYKENRKVVIMDSITGCYWIVNKDNPIHINELHEFRYKSDTNADTVNSAEWNKEDYTRTNIVLD